MAMKRIVYEFRQEGVTNRREACFEPGGDREVIEHDLDAMPEHFVGGDEWKGVLSIKARDVLRLVEELRRELGNLELLDLLERKFGGTIQACTKFRAWLDQEAIPYTHGSWA